MMHFVWVLIVVPKNKLTQVQKQVEKVLEDTLIAIIMDVEWVDH